MDSIPEKIRPLVRRLESIPSLSRQDFTSIIFIVRLCNILHRSFYGTFLTLSLAEHLANHLGVPDLTLDVQVFCMQWSFRQGEVMVSNRITFDYDMYTVYTFTKIGRAVLTDSISAKEGLRLIKQHETKQDYNRIEAGYRSFPSRALVIPLMSALCATVFFDGTWYDLGFAALCGLAAGVLTCITMLHDQLLGVMDYLVAIVTAMISVVSVLVFPDNTCFLSQVLGTLYWYFYGTAFVLSLYEVTNNQVLTGASRLIQATVRSYGLAFGAMIGGWLVSFAPGTSMDIIFAECSEKSSQIEELWFVLLFPMAGIACLMQFRVSLEHFPICLMVQIVAYGSQYVLGTVWEQPEFISNMVPAFLASLASAVGISILRRLKLSTLEVNQSVTYGESKKHDWPLLTIDDEDVESLECADTSSIESQAENLVEHEVEVQLSSSSRDVTPPGKNQPHLDSVSQLPEMSREPRMRRAMNSSKSDIEDQPRNSDVIGFVDATSDYIENDELMFGRSDLWFCLLPALYLLVPGSKIFQAGFSVILSSVLKDPNAPNVDALLGAVIVIGVAQVIGLRLGFVTLWLNHEAGKRMQRRCNCCRSTKPETKDVIDKANEFARRECQ